MFLRLHLYLERYFFIVFFLSTINKLIIIIIIIIIIIKNKLWKDLTSLIFDSTLWGKLTYSQCRSSNQRCSLKNMFLEISQNSQENTCVRVSFLKNTFFTQHFWATASNGGFRETQIKKNNLAILFWKF